MGPAGAHPPAPRSTCSSRLPSLASPSRLFQRASGLTRCAARCPDVRARPHGVMAKLNVATEPTEEEFYRRTTFRPVAELTATHRLRGARAQAPPTALGSREKDAGRTSPRPSHSPATCSGEGVTNTAEPKLDSQ
jgi:hypothetical protein